MMNTPGRDSAKPVGTVPGDRMAGLVEQAQRGESAALDELVSEHLQLVYNIVGRALAGHPDTDDVVQETLLQVVLSLGALRDPASFRSWTVAITMNQIRRRWRGAQPTQELEDSYPLPDPGADFAELTIVRLGLSDQRREVVEATRWLDQDDRELLALWWLEAAGELSRGDLAAAMELSPQHAAVRVQRMKGQLETARVVVRALRNRAFCPALSALTADWDEIPSALWRKRTGRHVQACETCSRQREGLVPAEGLLAGLAMVPVPSSYGPTGPYGLTAGTARTSPPAHHASGSRRLRQGSHRRGRSHWPVLVTATAVTAVAAAGALLSVDQSPARQQAAIGQLPPRAAVATAAAVSPSPRPAASVSTRAIASPTASPSHLASATARPRATTSASASTASSYTPTAAARGADSGVTLSAAEQQVLALINQARSAQGLAPLTPTSGLQASAAQHDTTMADGCGLSHQCPGEPPIGQRETDQGVHWTAAGENIGDGGPVDDSSSAEASMAVGLTQSMLDEKPPNDGHRANILSTSYTHIGISVIRDSSGTVWLTQDFSD